MSISSKFGKMAAHVANAGTKTKETTVSTAKKVNARKAFAAVSTATASKVDAMKDGFREVRPES